MSFAIENLLSRRELSAPDGRLLHAYGVTDTEFAAIGELVSRKAIALPAPRLFVLWASEVIRREHKEGLLSWEFLLTRLGPKVLRTQTVDMVTEGLAFWKRSIRRRASDDHYLYLYSLMAEGGLPDAFLARGSGYASAVLGTIGDIEREALGPGDLSALDRVATRRLQGLPAVFQNTDSSALLRDLAMGFVELRRDLPELLGIDAAERWLDRNRPGWADRLPLRLSEDARRAILLPALARQVERPSGGALAERLLVPTGGGQGWMGALRLNRGGLLPFGLLGHVDRSQILRFVAADGRSFRASPDLGGWRLEAPRDLILPLEPWRPAVLSGYADGVLLGDVVVDPGLPEPQDGPLLWRAEDAGSDMPQALVPAVGGRSRATQLWVLADKTPVLQEGLTLGAAIPGPGGLVWPVSGRGRLTVGVQALDIVTGADEDAPSARLMILADSFREGQVENGLPAFVGNPRFLGGRGDLPLRDVTGQVRVTRGRGLGTCRCDWLEEGQVISSTRAVLLPAALRLTLREQTSGLDVEVAGLPDGWRLAVHLGGRRHLLPTGERHLSAGPSPVDQGEVPVELFDAEGKVLVLRRSWPAREPMLIDPAGRRLLAPRQVSLSSLLGWRGVLPQKGAVELRMPNASHPVAFVDTGTLRLAAWRPLLAQVQALSGADGQVDLTLSTDCPSPTLKVSRHDWQPDQLAKCFDLGPVPVSLHASTVHAPVITRATLASGLFDPATWLGDVPHLWYVQGRSEAGVMRPFPWSGVPIPTSTRAQRIDGYRSTMAQMMAEPMHPAWGHLTEVLAAARAGGDCGALDQVQALGDEPQVAVALLFRAEAGAVASVLELETEAPLWWPAVTVSAWVAGIGASLALVEMSLGTAGFDAAGARDLAARHLGRMAGKVLALRPELSGHLGRAMVANGLVPVAIGVDERIVPLASPKDPERLKSAARQLAARGPEVPQGATALPLRRLALPSGFYEGLTPLLAAPLVVAESVLSLRPRLTPNETLDLLALRHVDPTWFDIALPLGISLA